MNLEKLEDAEANFLAFYPKGFEDEALLPIVKRHNTAKIGEQVQKLFAPECFENCESICESFARIVGKSTLISLFEKPKVREMIKHLPKEDQKKLCTALFEVLHGNNAKGFEALVALLASYKLAKWSIVTLIPYYYAREQNFFIKPNTTKGILNYFEIEHLLYKPRPSYEFYRAYSELLLKMKQHVTPLVGKDNAGFTGFLMMALPK